MISAYRIKKVKHLLPEKAIGLYNLFEVFKGRF